MTTMSGDTLTGRLRRMALFAVSAVGLIWVVAAPDSRWIDRERFNGLALAFVIGAVYLLVETTAVTFRFGRVSQSITIVELPLMAGLLCLGPLAHVIVRALAQGTGTYARLRKSKRRGLPWLILVNGAQGALEVTVFSALAQRLHFRGTFFSDDLLALLVAFAGVSLVAPVIWIVFQSAPNNRFPVRSVVQENLRVAEFSFVIFAADILLIAIVVANPVAGGLFIALIAALVHPLRQYTKLSIRAEETANLFRFSDLLSQSRDATDFSKILDHAAKTARGGETEVVLLNVRNLASGSALVIRGDTRISQALTSLPTEWPEIMSVGKSRIMRAGQPWRNAKTSMAAPLLVNGVAIGLLVVSSHSDEFHNFTPEDVTILETLARHLALWLEQDRLLDALEVEIEERHHDALRDPITDLANRAAFTDRLNKLIEQKTETSILLINLTHFKVVNEHYGHDAGDQLLAAIGKRITEAVPSDVFVARLGGDEFTVCLPRTSLRQAERIAGELIRVFRTPHLVGNDEVEIGAAIGIAQYPIHGNDVTFVMRSADNAMYQAKSATDGIFTHESPKPLRGANSLARTVQLRRAIEGFCVIPHYQPLVDVWTGRVTGFEALARWQVGPGEFIPPDEFIALAEETHLIHELTLQMASTALSDLSSWRRLPGYDALTVSVNISPVSLGRRDVTEQLMSLLRQLGLPPAALTLEITESRVMADPERSIRHLKDLAAEGLKLAIDDFGAGQTSLSYLADLPVHQLKIDRGFLLEAIEKPTARRLLATMVALGRDLDHMVTVEGIETSEHWHLIRELGAHKAQGYFIAKAMSTPATGEWLQNDALFLLESLGVGQLTSAGSTRG